MKKIVNRLLALIVCTSAPASAAVKLNYGVVLELKEIKGAKTSVDDSWIKYDNNLYCRTAFLDEKDLTKGILFTESPDIVGATISNDKEFLFYNRNGYQKFRTSWESSKDQTRVFRHSPARAIIFAGVMTFGILGMNRVMKKRE